METIKLKMLDEAGHTLMTCDADTAVSLVYTNCYKPGDRVALEIDHPGQYCVIPVSYTHLVRQGLCGVELGFRAAAQRKRPCAVKAQLQARFILFRICLLYTS